MRFSIYELQTEKRAALGGRAAGELLVARSRLLVEGRAQACPPHPAEQKLGAPADDPADRKSAAL